VSRLWRLLKDEALWVAAYKKLTSSPGSMTPGGRPGTIDGTSMKTLRALQQQVLEGTYEFGPTRRVAIPKPSGGERQLGVPTLKDRVVQEVCRSILEAMYEPTFSPRSHGFRPGMSQHTALRQIRRDFGGVAWFLEGELAKFFDKVDHDLLLGILSRRIQDVKFLLLIRKIITTNVVVNSKRGAGGATRKIERPLLGTPQGATISPLLSNILLHELDSFMEKKIAEYMKGQRRRHNPEYQRRYRAGGIKAASQVPSVDMFDPNFRRMAYVRYADDFLVGFVGPRKDVVQFRRELEQFLTKLKLLLSPEKTLITHSRQGANFLSCIITKTFNKAHKRTTTGGSKITVVRSGRVYLKADIGSSCGEVGRQGVLRCKGQPRPELSVLPRTPVKDSKQGEVAH